MDVVLTTKRLTVRPFSMDDAEFALGLLNDPSFIENIADKGVRTLEDAERYLREGPMASYEQHGFGLWRVGLKGSDVPIGMAGILKREHLDDVDLGYAFLPEYWRQGYAFEVNSAVIKFAREELGFHRVAAIVNVDNEPSIKLLEKLGFTYERMTRLEDYGDEMKMFVSVA